MPAGGVVQPAQRTAPCHAGRRTPDCQGARFWWGCSAAAGQGRPACSSSQLGSPPLLRRLQFTEGAAWPPSRHSMAEPTRLSSLPRIDSARAMTQADELGGHPLSRVPTWEALADAARQLEESRRQLTLPSPTGAAPGMSFRGLGSM